MADNPDTPEQGRMLFTDMDIQDKGRPGTAILDADGRDAAVPHLASLDDIAANIGLDFLDDDDISASMPEAAPGPTSEPSNHAAAASAAPVPAGPEQSDDLGDKDDVLSLEDLPSATALGNQDSTSGEVLTWESFADAFRHQDGKSRSGESEQGPLPGGLPVPAEEFFNPRLTDDNQNDVSGTIFASAPNVDGITEDLFPADSVDELLEDEDADILSILMPPAAAAGPESVDSSRRRAAPTVPPPPAVPYGGLERVEDWYVPPEEEERVFTMPTDWYEPPEEIRDGGGDAAEGTPAAGDASPGARQSTSRRGRDTRSGTTKRRPASHDTAGALDLFSDFDLDEVWEERVKSEADKSPDTRSLDLFNDLDIEQLWEQRSPSHTIDALDLTGGIDLESLQARYGDLAASDTLILDTGQNDAASTVIIPSDQLAASRPEGNDTARFTQPNDQDVAAELLAELDSLGEDGGSGPGAQSPQAGDGRAESTANESDDLDDFGEVADYDDADAFDDTDAPEGATPRRRRKPKRSSGDDITFGDPRRGYGPRRDNADAGDESPRPRRRSAKPLFDNDSPDPTMVSGTPGEEDEQIDDVTMDQEATAPEAEGPGLTADDLLEEGFDDIPGIDADLSAPVIDDSAITSTTGPKPGTEEMEAIMAHHEGGDDDDLGGDTQAGMAEGDGGEDGGEGGEGEDDDTPVALNPMDVFANMDDMDFSDDMDDEMRAMLDDEEAEAEGGEGDQEGAAEPAPLLPPDGFLGKVSFTLGRIARRYLPDGFLERLQQMVAWRENWWFYCDLVAAIIASASLAIIISYYIWYRN